MAGFRRQIQQIIEEERPDLWEKRVGPYGRYYEISLEGEDFIYFGNAEDALDFYIWAEGRFFASPWGIKKMSNEESGI